MDYRRKYGATHANSGSLCETCVYALIIQGHAESEMVTICDNPYPWMKVPFKVKECSGFLNRQVPDVDELSKIALDLTVDKVRRAGFEGPERKLQPGFAREVEPQTEVAEPVLAEDG